jgi:hypothetical protein
MQKLKQIVKNFFNTTTEEASEIAYSAHDNGFDYHHEFQFNRSVTSNSGTPNNIIEKVKDKKKKFLRKTKTVHYENDEIDFQKKKSEDLSPYRKHLIPR